MLWKPGLFTGQMRATLFLWFVTFSKRLHYPSFVETLRRGVLFLFSWSHSLDQSGKEMQHHTQGYSTTVRLSILIEPSRVSWAESVSLTLCFCEIILSELIRMKQGWGGTTEGSLQSLRVGQQTAASTTAQVSMCICLDLWPCCWEQKQKTTLSLVSLPLKSMFFLSSFLHQQRRDEKTRKTPCHGSTHPFPQDRF